MVKQKKPRFVCDNCGAEIAASEKRCPQCSRYFSSIRCPKCGFTGQEEQFLGGCPGCGAAKTRSVKKAPPPKPELPTWAYAVAIGVMVLALSLLFFCSGLRR
ncbi:MAG: hypothetical protein LBS82_05835 [Spirochaetaceae bacterium]|jgi:predicted RNA-binding Zn-ribbon protein involved in translation (DUF1610 family)|nr:hypothetical protein [Spirochaetaceae bacterium]